MSFVLYDVETTGTRWGYDQILQFAAIQTDFELQEIASFELSARLSPHIVPSPRALFINRHDIRKITDLNRPSHYAMVCDLRKRLENWAPCAFLGFNSFRFDEEFLRHAFYQCLFPPYLTNTPPNTRGDVLHLVRAFASFQPEDIIVPFGVSGAFTFALRDLALANGFPDFDAHDAMGDVRAMLHLCRLVAVRAPDIWSRYQRFSQKQNVVEFISDEPLFVHFDASWRRQTRCVTRLGVNPEQANIHYCLALPTDVEWLSQLGPDDLARFLFENNAAIVRLKANTAPILCSLEDAPAHLLSDQSKTECLTQANRLRENPGLVERLCIACITNEIVYEPSAYLEAQIYEQPFWPGVDEDQLRLFHQIPWGTRHKLLSTFSDKRSRQLARRLIYIERPDLLPEQERHEFAQRVRRRIVDDQVEVPWLTVPGAQRELAELLAEVGLESQPLLASYDEYLKKLACST